MVYHGKHSVHLRHLHKGGSVQIHPQHETDSSARVDPSFPIINKSSKLMPIDVSQSAKPFPLSSGIPTSTGTLMQSQQTLMPRENGKSKNYLGGHLANISFGKKEKDKKVKLRI